MNCLYAIDFFCKKSDCFAHDIFCTCFPKISFVYSSKSFVEKLCEELNSNEEFLKQCDVEKVFVLEVENSSHLPRESPILKDEVKRYGPLITNAACFEKKEKISIKRFKTEATVPSSFKSDRDKKFWFLKEEIFPKAETQTFRRMGVVCLDVVSNDDCGISMYANHGDLKNEDWKRKILIAPPSFENIWEFEEILYKLKLLKEDSELGFKPCYYSYQESMTGHVYYLPEKNLEKAARFFWYGMFPDESEELN